MKIIKNEKLIKRNATIGNWTSIGALAVLGGGMYLSFIRSDLFMYSLASLLVGFTLTQVGMYMGNKYGRSPRLDQQLDAGLKGLQNEFVMYHYATPASHLLVGPAGVWIVMPYQQRGQVTYKNNRWRMGGGGFLQGYMRIFGQENIGRPDIETDSEISSLKKFFSKHMEESEIPEINALMVFTNDATEVDAEGAPIPAMKLKTDQGFLPAEGQGKTHRTNTTDCRESRIARIIHFRHGEQD